MPLDLSLRRREEADSSVTHSSGSPLAAEDDPYYRELQHFLDHLDTNTPLKVSPQDGLMAVKIALAAIESMRTGQPVDVASFAEVQA
jgi:myo-inositol 2-dehydrogenase/D-chiro-inositol 1-dehydrogenase